MRMLTTMSSGARHAAVAVTEAALVAAIGAALVLGTAVATRHDPAGAAEAFARSTTASISLASVNGLYSATLQPSLGDTVTFDVTVPKNINNPRVQLMCYQSGQVVYGETGSIGQARGDGTDSLGYYGFKLGGGGSLWLSVGGPANCVANLFYFGQKAGVQTFNVLASDPFSAEG